jgi:hypothetical protein
VRLSRRYGIRDDVIKPSVDKAEEIPVERDRRHLDFSRIDQAGREEPASQPDLVHFGPIQ